MASITTYFRLEPDPLRPDVTIGATAPVHDPLWLLARQWQLGEFAAQDGGTPVVARWRGVAAEPTRFVAGPIPPNPAELLSSARMVELLALAADKFDQVIVDSPPLLGLADALIIGNLCEGTLLTVEMGGTPRGYVQGAFKRLRSARVHVLGTVLTKLAARQGAYGYSRSYYYYHTDYYGEALVEAKKLPV